MDGTVWWTIDELAARVAEVLSVNYPGAASGRVRDLPDRRAIRWYTTIGLVDRPAASHGRTALYGRRHLLQLVAIKRLQAAGHPLARIQARLAGATDDLLDTLAQLPDEPPADPPPADPPPQEPPPARPRFWVTRPQPAPAGTTGTGPTAGPEPGRSTPAGPAPAPDGAVHPLHGLALPGGYTLILPPGTPPPTGDDLDAVRAAARPLLDLLATRPAPTDPVPTGTAKPSPGGPR